MSERWKSVMTYQGKKPRGRDTWRTPPELFQALEQRFGRFIFDVAADADNAQCAEFYTAEQDALRCVWPEGLCFCNPPFTKKAAFIDKAADEDRPTIMVLPGDTSTAWFHRAAEVAELYLLLGRVAFMDENNKPISGNPGGTVIAEFGNGAGGIYAWDWKKDVMK